MIVIIEIHFHVQKIASMGQPTVAMTIESRWRGSALCLQTARLKAHQKWPSCPGGTIAANDVPYQPVQHPCYQAIALLSPGSHHYAVEVMAVDLMARKTKRLQE